MGRSLSIDYREDKDKKEWKIEVDHPDVKDVPSIINSITKSNLENNEANKRLLPQIVQYVVEGVKKL
ncbi:MAG: hypothetical protein QME81_00335 [bacterium]|nr:hypothetical protein [bacterium]